MSRSRRLVVNLLKLAIFAALIAFVLQSIQLRDGWARLDAAGVVVASGDGAILGRWDEKPVRIRLTAADGSVSELTAGPAPAGERVEITPGFLTYLRNLNPWVFALGALCYFFSMTLAAARWWWLLRVNRLDVTLLEAQRFTWIGAFFNNVVPGQTGGDLVKAVYIMKRCPGGRVPALVSVVVDRVLGLASLALLGAIVVLFQLERFGWIAASIWGVVGAVALGFVVAFSRRIRRAIRLDVLLNKFGRVSHALQRIDQAVYFYRGHKRGICTWMLVGIANHVVSVTSFWLVGEALGVGLPAVEYFVLIPVINIVSAVPIAPNGWGIGEALFGELFGRFGAVYLPGAADAAQTMYTRGVALSVLYRVHLAIWSLLGGVLASFERDRVTKRDLDEEIAREEAEDEEAVERARRPGGDR